MRLIAALALASALLTGAAPPPESELQRDADRLVATTKIPAVITLVEQDGQRVVVAAGHAQVGGRQARPEDRFWVGSVTKTFIATAVMQLVAEHRIRLDDTVHRYLPGRLRAGRRIRIRHLSNHTSGIPEYMQLRAVGEHRGAQPTGRDPGEAAHLVGGEASARVPARAARRPTRTRTTSCSARSSSVSPTDVSRSCSSGESSHRSAWRQPPSRAGNGRFRPTRCTATTSPGSTPRDVSLQRLGGPWADGAIVSNARDLAVFFGALLRGQLVPPTLVAQMRTIVPGLAR